MNILSQVRRAGLNTIEASLLFGQAPMLDIAAISAELQTMTDGELPEIVERQGAGSNLSVVLRADGCEIVIDVEDAPRPRAAFIYALDWPLLHRAFPEADEVLGSHAASVQVTVVAEYDLVANDMGLDNTNSGMVRSLMAARVVAALCRLAKPMAIYWQPSEMVFKPGTFLREFEIQPVSVLTRVTPFTSNRLFGGVRAVGGSTRGASLLLGKETVLEEAPVPVDWVTSTLHSFVAASVAEGAYLPHLSVYAPTQGDVIIVRHLDWSPEINRPHISLDVRRIADIGYNAEAVPQSAEAQQPRPGGHWDGQERRMRPRTAKPFGRRGLS